MSLDDTEAEVPQEEPEDSQTSEQPATSEPGSPNFENLEEAIEESSNKKIDFLFDIDLDVNIELGRAALKVKDILQLQRGSVVELNRLAGDPVEVVVNNKLIARGEVIVIDENFAVRVTDIVSPGEIVKSIGR